MTYHVAIWLDHTEAHIYAIGPDDYVRSTVKSTGERHQHHRAGAVGAGHAHRNDPYYHAVAEAAGAAHEIYVCGPGLAKTEFMHHVEAHDKGIAKRVVKVDTADHPSDGQVVAAARKVFKAIDRMTPQI
ncbi:MAG: translational machinery protein [Alphaproteobacteria bacterium]|nr:translational machinery protein [Alphaproteobacteria bacterium]